MDPVSATRFPAKLAVCRKFRPNLLSFSSMTSSAAPPYEIHTASRGHHWIGWVTLPGSDEPERSIILIGKTREEAESRARAWLTSMYKSH
jgi:hypothetical protein